MQKWEYLSAYVDWAHRHWAISHINGRELPNWKTANMYDTLNALGDEGWELVATTSYVLMGESKSPNYMFKRPKVG